MDVAKEVGFAVLGGSTTEAQGAKVVGFAVLGATSAQVEAAKVVSFAVIDDTVPPAGSNSGAALLLFM